jgi:predicted Zn-dependent peptidase
MPGFLRATVTVLLGMLMLTGAVSAGNYMDLQDEIQEFTLDNGIHFMVLERHDVPVFSFRTYVNVGSVNEVTGVTGIAHILEHMAFKGTNHIATTDYKNERKAMEAEDKAFHALRDELNKGFDADPAVLEQLRVDFEAAKDVAREFVISNEFGTLVENNGGNGMNATTGADATNYFYNMPSNRLELWAYLEGTRMSNPVFREFYMEKDGPVTEERRMRTENSPFGMLMEQFLNMAFSAHPYHHSTIGYMSDIESISRQDCIDFYEKWYVGNNFTVAVVGDVELAEVKKLANKYFSKVPGPSVLPAIETVEPVQKGEKRIVVMDDTQPIIMVGYHKGGMDHPDDAVYDAIADITGQGRTSRLHTKLVKESKLCVAAGCFSGFPGTKYPNLMLVYAIPAKDISTAEVEEALYAELDKLVEDGVTEEELAGVKKRTKANFIRSLGGNQGMAGQLCAYQALTGDWRDMFKTVEKIETVTVEDIKRVSAEMFIKSNRTVAIIETEEEK